MSTSHSVATMSYAMFGFEGDGQYIASVVDVHPTATTLEMRCGDIEACYRQIVKTATFGPWAQQHPPDHASTGVYDVRFTDTFMSPHSTVSVHCEVVSTTVPLACTTINLLDGAPPSYSGYTYRPTETIKPATASYSQWDMHRFEIFVTAGFEKFATASASSASSTPATASAAHSSAVSSSPPSTPASHPGSQNPSITSPAHTSATSAAASNDGLSNVHGSSMGMLSIFALVAAYLVR